MKIGFVYNLKPKNIDFSQPEAEFYAEFDTPTTINAIGEAIKKNGYEVMMMDSNEDLYEKLKQQRNEIDLLFNFAEAINAGGADRRSQVPMLCEILKIPYSGPTPLVMGLILNKYRAKEIWQYYGVATAPWQVFENENEELRPELTYPLIVKANNQGSSMGIRNNSVVESESGLRERIKENLDKFGGLVLVEKFLEGREFTVPVLGNGEELEVLPIVEMSFEGLPAGMNKLNSYEVKWIHDSPDNPNRVESTICPAKIDEGLKNKIEELVKRAFATIGCRDWGRVDLRMDLEGNLYVLEINNPVGLLPEPESSMLPISAKAAGIGYDELIGKIIGIALKRYRKI